MTIGCVCEQKEKNQIKKKRKEASLLLSCLPLWYCFICLLLPRSKVRLIKPMLVIDIIG